MLQFLRPFSSKRFSIERMIISFVWQRYGKRHEKAPDMTENRMPGVQVLN